MANELNPVKTNGSSDQRLDKLDVALREHEPPRADDAFTLAGLADYLARSGREEQEWTRSFGQHLIETQRRKLAYLEAVVGKLVK